MDLAVIGRSRKQPRSKRRKAMASARRKMTAASARDVEYPFQELLGADFSVLYEREDLLILNKAIGVNCFDKHLKKGWESAWKC
jgi:23S rRNA-/tRNA-specific pseudouridylate synthase